MTIFYKSGKPQERKLELIELIVVKQSSTLIKLFIQANNGM